MPIVNESWCSKVLNIQLNPGNGADLIDDQKIIEVKFALTPNKKNYTSWKILEHQVNYQKENAQRFWALGTYTLNKPIFQIKTKDFEKLEKLVLHRELFIVNWDWISQFTPSYTNGKTDISKWENTFRYAKKNKLPKTIQTYSVHKGIVNLTQETQKQYFPHLQ